MGTGRERIMGMGEGGVGWLCIPYGMWAWNAQAGSRWWAGLGLHPVGSQDCPGIRIGIPQNFQVFGI